MNKELMAINHKILKKGGLLFNPNGNVLLFQFMGHQYTSNFNRQKPYRLHHEAWTVYKKLSVFEKISMVFSKKFKKLRKFKRAHNENLQ